MKLASSYEVPRGVLDHVQQRVRERSITMTALDKLRFWVDSRPEVPEGYWHRDFETFYLCGHGRYPSLHPFVSRNATSRISGGTGPSPRLVLIAQVEVTPKIG